MVMGLFFNLATYGFIAYNTGSAFWLWAAIKKSLYAGGRPDLLAKALNAIWAKLCAWGIAPHYLGTLEFTGRKSGKTSLSRW